MAQNVMMQLLLEIRQFRQAWQQAATAAQTGAQRIARSARSGGRAMGQATKKATGFAKAMDFLGKRVIGAGLFFAAFYQGLITFRQLIGDAVRELFDLDDALRRIQSITKESDLSIAHLRKELISLAKAGRLFDQSAAEVADSMFSIAQAGFDSAESLVLAQLAAEGAAVGFTTAEVSAKVLVGVLKAYDMPVSKARDVMDVLFQTVDTGIVTFEDLASGLGKVLASANSLNIPLEEVNAAIATMTLRGFTADQAMTSLGRIMQTFIRPSQRAKESAEALGLELDADTIASQGLIATMQEMFLATGGNVTRFAELFDRIQSTRGAISLFSDDGQLLAAVMHEMTGATADAGAMAKALEERAKSVKFQLGVLRSQILAVVTGALQPFMHSLAGVVGMMNKILAGKVGITNYFADIDALVTALVITLLWMKRQAFAALFTKMAMGLKGLGTMAAVSRLEVGLFGTAMRGLQAVMSTLAPLLIFMAVFALAKYAGQMKNAESATRKLEDATEQFENKLDALRGLNLAEDLLNIQEVELAADALSSLVDELANDFQTAGEDIQTVLGKVFGEGFDEGMDRAINAVVSLGQNTESELSKMRGEFQDTVDLWIEGAVLTSDQLVNLGGVFAILERDASTSKQAELYGLVAERLGVAAEKASEFDDFIADAKQAAVEFAAVTGDAIMPAKNVRDAIKEWLKPIEAAKGLMEDILGLTGSEDLKLRMDIAPIMTGIARRNEEIYVLKGQILSREDKLIEAGADVSDIEDTILGNLESQIETLERKNEMDQNTIDQKESLLETEEKIDAELQSALSWLDLQLGKLPALLALTNEQQRTLAVMVKIMREQGVPALEDWIVAEKEIGRLFSEDVMAALLDVVEKMDDNVLEVDVTESLNRLGLVGTELTILKAQLRAGALSPGAFQFGAGILRTQVQAAAHGLQNFMGGMALVGEAGPELLRLPRGSDVIPNNMIGPTMRQNARGDGNGGLHVSAEVNIQMEQDYEKLKRRVLQEVEEQLDNAAATASLSKPRFGTWGAGIPRT